MFSLCRLCAKCMNVSESTAEICDLESKLRLCCGWKPTENEDGMPQKACSMCVDQLQRSYSFAESVWLAEEQLIKLGTELKQSHFIETTHIEEILTDSIKTEPNTVAFELGEIEQIFDDSIFEDPIIQSDAENPLPIKTPRKRKKTTKKQTAKENSNTDKFLAYLSDEDRLLGGIISQNGVAKLEKIFPEMKAITWNDCQYKCEQCNRKFNSPQNFFAHNRSIHLGEVQSMEFYCFYCDFKHCREFNLNKHIAEKHFIHLKYR